MDEKQKIQGNIRKLSTAENVHYFSELADIDQNELVNLHKCYPYWSKNFIKLMIHNKVRFFE